MIASLILAMSDVELLAGFLNHPNDTICNFAQQKTFKVVPHAFVIPIDLFFFYYS